MSDKSVKIMPDLACEIDAVTMSGLNNASYDCGYCSYRMEGCISCQFGKVVIMRNAKVINDIIRNVKWT